MLETSGRLLRLLSLLQARRDWPGPALAERLDVSPRTVRRDVDRLRELGYPVRATKGPDGGYRLDAGADVPPLLFDDEQAVAVAIALRTGALPGVEDAAARALATIRQVMPARLRTRIDALEVTAVPGRRERSLPAVRPDVLVAVGTAASERRVLRFDYDGGTGEVLRAPGSGAGEGFRAPRRVEPHHVVTWGGRWYLVAWDLDRDDWRTFRIDRMAPREGVGARFERRALPAPDVATFIAERFTQPVMPVRGTVELELDAAVVAAWAGSGALVEAVGEGRCRLTAGSWSWGGLAGWFGIFDAPFTVVGPEDLRAAVARLAARATAAAAPAAAGRPPRRGTPGEGQRAPGQGAAKGSGPGHDGGS
ncbi:helix-turn-helix transcriptional regulator [Cellulosimicrobium sp. SH8]|uniref:helix-turn-helix transcriptional regulator n=1 Tax=Cellulosimicrobium sp. SH8 TaxID=2952936 RepID=UPI0021F34527|nr:WYL domain-containing protein [Cellulosimicrobium sp. SH8]